MKTYFCNYPREFANECNLLYVENADDEKAIERLHKHAQTDPNHVLEQITRREALHMAAVYGRYIVPAESVFTGFPNPWLSHCDGRIVLRKRWKND